MVFRNRGYFAEMDLIRNLDSIRIFYKLPDGWSMRCLTRNYSRRRVVYRDQRVFVPWSFPKKGPNFGGVVQWGGKIGRYQGGQRLRRAEISPAKLVVNSLLLMVFQPDFPLTESTLSVIISTRPCLVQKPGLPRKPRRKNRCLVF